MFNDLLRRIRRQARALGGSRRDGGSHRIEICPPALLHGCVAGTVGWRAGLRDWLSTGWSPSSSALAGTTPARPADDSRFVRVRDEFLLTLEDIRTQQAGLVQARIRVARSLRELWHLRPELFRLVALHFSQTEAQRRLERLNRHFPTRSPRSGFAPLEPASAEARPTRRA